MWWLRSHHHQAVRAHLRLLRLPRRQATTAATKSSPSPPPPPTPPPPPASAASSSSSSSSSPSLWQRYNTLLQTHPIKTKMITSGTLMAAGDIACQTLTHYHKESEKEEKDKDPNASLQIDTHRTAKFGFMGLGVGSILHGWYGLLFRLFPTQTMASALKRLAMDQCLFAPTFIPIFFTGLQFLDGNTDMGKIQKKLEADYLDTLKANYMLWVPAMLINFRFVPMEKQVLFSNFVGFWWNIFMSFVSHK